MKYDPRDENSIKAVMAKANVVLNLIGRLSSLVVFSVLEVVNVLTWELPSMTGREYETRNYSFEEVNYSMAEQLAMVGSYVYIVFIL